MIQETSRQPGISPLAGQPAPKEMLIRQPHRTRIPCDESPIWMLAGPAA